MNTTFQHKRKGNACKLLNTVACVFVLCEIPHFPIQKKKMTFSQKFISFRLFPIPCPLLFFMSRFWKNEK